MRALRSAWPLLALGVVLLFAARAPAQTAGPTTLEEGLRLLKERRYDEAKRALGAAAEASPTNPEPWIGLGNAELATQNHQGAIAAFEKALSLAPDNLTVRYNLAFALRKGSRPKDAAAAYRSYLEQKPEDADAWYGLAEALREAKDAEGAAVAYERYAERENRPDRETWVEKARRQAAALRAYAGAPSTEAKSSPAPTANVEDEPTKIVHDPALNLEEVHLALNQGRFDAALAALERLPPETQKTPYVAAALAAGYLGRGDAERAIQWYRSALVVAPAAAKPALLFGLAEAHRRDGNTKAAREALRAVVQAEDPNLKALAEARLAALESS